MQILQEEVAYGLHEDTLESSRSVFRDRIRILLESGERPPLVEYDELALEPWKDYQRRERIKAGLVLGATAATSFVAGVLLRRRGGN